MLRTASTQNALDDRKTPLQVRSIMTASAEPTTFIIIHPDPSTARLNPRILPRDLSWDIAYVMCVPVPRHMTVYPHSRAANVWSETYAKLHGINQLAKLGSLSSCIESQVPPAISFCGALRRILRADAGLVWWRKTLSAYSSQHLNLKRGAIEENGKAGRRMWYSP